MQTDGTVQPGGSRTLRTTGQDCDEKGRGAPPHITERMELEAVRRITDQLFPQLPTLVVALWEAECHYC